MDLNSIAFNVSAYSEGIKTKRAQLNWESIAYKLIVLPACAIVVVTANDKSNPTHQFFRLFVPACAIAAGIRKFYNAEEFQEVSEQFEVIKKQQQLGIKQTVGTDHWKQGQILKAIAQSEVQGYYPQQQPQLAPVQAQSAVHGVEQSAVHYAAQSPSPAYSGGDLNAIASTLGKPNQGGFDWSLVTKFHHLLVIGVTGGGKTTLVQWIVKTFCQDSQVLVIDPHYKPGEWEGLPVAGKGRNFAECEEFLAKIMSEMDRRYEKRSQGIEDWNRLVVIIDELPAVIANTERVKEMIPALSQEARKVGIVLVILATGWEVVTLGLEGKGSQRNNFTKIDLGKFAQEKAKKLKDQHLLQRLQNTPRACLVDDQFAIVPDLSNFHSGNYGSTSQNSGKYSTEADYGAIATTEFPFPGNDFQGQNQENSFSETEILLVKALLDNGVSDTQIIKTVFKPSGRNWSLGREKLTQIKVSLGIVSEGLEIHDAIEEAEFEEAEYAIAN